jgi:hypothetical protein
MNGAPNGIYAYLYSNNSIVEFRSAAGPGNTALLSTWAVNSNASAMSVLRITDVAPSTYIAGYGYLTVQSSLSGLAQRLFYQTTNGNIVSAYHSRLAGSAGCIRKNSDNYGAQHSPLLYPCTHDRPSAGIFSFGRTRPAVLPDFRQPVEPVAARNGFLRNEGLLSVSRLSVCPYDSNFQF